MAMPQDVQWRGVAIGDFIRQLQVEPDASHVLLHCYGGYTTNLSWPDFAQAGNLLAHILFGQPLPPQHGGPLRLVVPHLYAWKSAKWINGIEVLDAQTLGFWERNGYHHRGDPWAAERYSDG